MAVIIPFFQRKSGLLLRAVKSALAQSVGRPHVIVIDDGSPIDAENELCVLSQFELEHVVVLKQANAGPGAARNRGLLSVPPQIDYIAFLDSDDEWLPNHLRGALTAFEQGADFYFTDYTPLDSNKTISAFERSDLRADDPIHTSLGEGLYMFGGDLFDTILRGSPVGTSTVVYRKAANQDPRFPIQFNYCEDAAFWLLLTAGNKKAIFSTHSEVIYGKGVNIAAGAKWGTPSVLPKLYGEYRFHQAMAERYVLNSDQVSWSKAYRRGISKEFLANLVHFTRRMMPIDWVCVAKFAMLHTPFKNRI